MNVCDKFVDCWIWHCRLIWSFLGILIFFFWSHIWSLQIHCFGRFLYCLIRPSFLDMLAWRQRCCWEMHFSQLYTSLLWLFLNFDAWWILSLMWILDGFIVLHKFIRPELWMFALNLLFVHLLINFNHFCINFCVCTTKCSCTALFLNNMIHWIWICKILLRWFHNLFIIVFLYCNHNGSKCGQSTVHRGLMMILFQGSPWLRRDFLVSMTPHTGWTWHRLPEVVWARSFGVCDQSWYQCPNVQDLLVSLFF